mgnify:CR=1 FL=1
MAFAPVVLVGAEQGRARTVVDGVGDLLGFPKGTLVDFVLRYVKKAVPAFNLPGAVRFTDAAGRELLAETQRSLAPVDADPGEADNLWDARPDVVGQLSGLLERYQRDGRSTRQAG